MTRKMIGKDKAKMSRDMVHPGYKWDVLYSKYLVGKPRCANWQGVAACSADCIQLLFSLQNLLLGLAA